MTSWLRCWFALFALSCVTQATAQLSNYGAPASSFLSSSRLVQQVANGATDAARGSNSAGAAAAAGIIVSRNGAPTAPKKLAAAYPEKGRAEAERVFASLLALYPQVEQKFGIPANDLAAAVALFLVSSVEAYRGVSIDPEQFKTLAAQLRRAMNANPDIAKAPEAEKQEMYEQMVVIGMFLQGVQEALKQTPNAQVAANMKVAAKGYLEQFLKSNPDHIDITAQGLSIQGGAPAQSAEAPLAEPTPPAQTAAREEPAAAPERTDAAATADQRAAAQEPTPGARGITAVVLSEGWTMGIGGSLVLRYRPVVLYSDGSYTRDAEKALRGNAPTSGRWRKEGAEYVLAKADGKTEKIRAKMVARPARAKQGLVGRYASMSGLGGGGTGTVNVLAGATLNTTSILGNDIWVGGHDTDDDIAAITSMGTLNVDGLGSFVETEDLNVGIFGGVGFLNITGGGVVNTADSTNADTQFGANDGFGGLKSTGTGVVDGDGSLLQSRSFLIGGSGTGTLEVRAGGRARTQISSALAGDATLGDNQGSNGKVAVHGTATDDTTASLLDVDDTLIVGDAGLGVLNIGRDLNGNEVGTGALQVDLQLLIGNAAGNTLDNKVVVSGANATANIGTNLQAGLSGKGIFEARNGATITVGGALGAGGLPAGNGTILIDGPGTTLTSSTMFLGNGNSGPLATGVMTVSDQAVVTFTSTANGVVTIGDDAFSAGTLTVTGAGSLVQSTGGTAEWWIGGSIADTGGAGTLNVLDGGQVTSTGRMVLGYIGGSTGYVTVDGTDSQVDANGDYILVGFNGVGNMDVTGGGVVNANRIFVADAVGSAGSELDITGPGSVVNIDRLLHVGDTVRGTVVVSAGGQLNVAVGVPTERLIIGDQGTADGSRLTVSGANSRVDYHGTADVAVGNAGGANTANINDRATLEVTAGGVFSAVQRNPDTSIASQARIIIGDVTGGNGRVLVDGAGSLVEASVIYVGDGDSASIGLSNPAALYSNTFAEG